MKKLIILSGILLVLGLPIVATWKMIILLAGIMLLICGDVNFKRSRVFVGVGAIVLILAIKTILPVAGIEEGHNIFLPFKEGEVLEKGLSPQPFNTWKQMFDKFYPFPASDYSWHAAGSPDSLYAYSSDSIWRPAKYSRVVDTIDFKNLGEFRGGFINELKYNWWQGRPQRAEVPFFVMYEFSKTSVGSVLTFMGNSKTILEKDVGEKTYLFFLPGIAPDFPVKLDLNSKLKISHAMKNILTVIGVFILLGMCVTVQWKPYLTGLIIVAVAMALVYSSTLTGFPLGSSYPAQMGGNDGLFHESKGRDMARLVSQGEIGEALRGGEDVYWFTPGTRYFRGVEKLFFGDTSLGYTMFLAVFPWVIYLILNSLVGHQWALFGTVLFFFSFIQHVFLGMIGFGEPVGSILFFIGLYLFMKSWPGGEFDLWRIFVGGLCLAGAVFVRPNYAIAVIILGLFYTYACYRTRDFKSMAIAVGGLSTALLMPLHNYVYGGKFVLITAASNLNLIKPDIAKQLSGWLGAEPFVANHLPLIVGITPVIKFIVLPVTAYAAIRGRQMVFVLAWVAIAAHATMLFINPANVFRYSILGWDLSTILTIGFAITFMENREKTYLGSKQTQQDVEVRHVFHKDWGTELFQTPYLLKGWIENKKKHLKEIV